MLKKMNILSLSWPIFIEFFLRMLLGNISTFVLSRYSDHAVAAVGISNQLISMLLILFNVVGFGSAVLVTQHLGAENHHTASKVGSLAIFVNLVFGICAGLLFVLSHKFLLRAMNLPSELMPDASLYLVIVGLFAFTQALIATMSGIIRSYGYTKVSMLIAAGMNILNIIGCYISIYRPFGIPVFGVIGVAISMVISEIIATIIMAILIVKCINIQLNPKAIFPFRKDLLKDILKIGLPSAGEHLSYNLSQIATTSIIAMLGTQALTTNVYCQTATSFIKILSYSIGAGSQILIGHLIGANKMEEAYKTCYTNVKIGALMNLSAAILFSIFRKEIVSLFTTNPIIIATGSTLIALTIILDTGRSFNSVIINCLRGAGDVQFPVIMGIISMWGVSVTLAYVLGVYLGLGLLGIWIAFSIDEWFRGLMMLWRWRSRAWEKMSFVSSENMPSVSKAS